ncbi:hypothetical protein MMC22_001813 [Lobaria immixta]|nr:hypothetical protein [Lobaria immixta]
MPATDSPAILVARFLRTNHYEATLEAFLAEAGLPSEAGTVVKGDLTIEKILEEKRIFDLSLNFEKLGVSDADREWSLPAPTHPVMVQTLPSAANLLHVSVEHTKDGESPGSSFQLLLATTADRRLNFIVPNPTFTLFQSKNFIHDSPILSCVTIGNQYLTTITTGMSGQVVLYDHKEEKVLDERRDHKKYVVQVAAWENGDECWIATAGWDRKVFLYQLENRGPQSAGSLGTPVASLTLLTNPETATFVRNTDANAPILLITRRDSTSLHYYALPTYQGPSHTRSGPGELRLLGLQNLAPHSNAWIAFSLSCVSLCPTDPTLLAVATSSVPHMKLIIVRILISALIASTGPRSGELSTQTDQTREKLAIQDREDAAILVSVSTLAPQTPYSTPQVCWRPDGSGVWVNGDDGALRGLEAKTGKIVATLKGGHEAGSKIRSVWAGMVGSGGEEEEWVVSGGFDRRLVVWKSEKQCAFSA